MLMSIVLTGTKPRLSIATIINMSVGFFGIQFAFGLQNANVSRIFQTLGAKIEEIPILWIAAPLTGLILQPIIGHFSDKTWLGKWGEEDLISWQVPSSLPLPCFFSQTFILYGWRL